MIPGKIIRPTFNAASRMPVDGPVRAAPPPIIPMGPRR